MARRRRRPTWIARTAGNLRQRRVTTAEGDPLADGMVSRLDRAYSPQLGLRAPGALRWGNSRAHTTTFSGYLPGALSLSGSGIGAARPIDSPNTALPATNGPVLSANQALALIGRLPTTPRG